MSAEGSTSLHATSGSCSQMDVGCLPNSTTYARESIQRNNGIQTDLLTSEKRVNVSDGG
jgi:hypothetical protein